jgi:hypothetical protein
VPFRIKSHRLVTRQSTTRAQHGLLPLPFEDGFLIFLEPKGFAGFRPGPTKEDAAGDA